MENFLLLKAILGLTAKGEVNTELFLFYDVSITHTERVRELRIKNARGAYVREFVDGSGRIEFDPKAPSTVKPATQQEVEQAMSRGIKKEDY